MAKPLEVKKNVGLTSEGKLMIDAALPIIRATKTFPAEFWVSTLARSKETALIIRERLGWTAPIRELVILDTIGEEARKKISEDCEVLFSRVKEYRAKHASASIGVALLASPDGKIYMRNKASKVLQMAIGTEKNLLIVVHENLANPLAWMALDMNESFAAIGGELRYVEGITMTLDDNGKIAKARILRNPYYR